MPALCIDNTDYRASLIPGKVYRIIPDLKAGKDDFVRVVDESSEDYLYHKSHFLFVDFAHRSVLPHLKRACRAMSAALFAGSSRWPGLPNVPAVAESGVPEYQLKGPFEGALGPPKMRRDVVMKIHAELVKAVDSPQLRDFFTASGWEAERRGPEEFRAFLNDEVRKYAEIAKVAKIRPE